MSVAQGYVWAYRPFFPPSGLARRRFDEPLTMHASAVESKDWSAAVVAIAQTKDRASFSELFLYFAPRLKAFYVRRGVSPPLAEELAQEVLLVVWRKAGWFDPERASAATWIFAIARNLGIDMKRREKPLPAEDYAEAMDAPDPTEQMMSLEQKTRVRAALQELPDEQAEVVRLSFFEDRAHGEIAERLAIPLGTVKSRIRLAMGRLRALMGDEA